MNSKKLPILISVALALVLFLWNSQKHPGVEDFNEGTGRNPSSEHSSYDVLLKKLDLRVARANLHAHHFMGGNPPKGQESAAKTSFLIFANFKRFNYLLKSLYNERVYSVEKIENSQQKVCSWIARES